MPEPYNLTAISQANTLVDFVGATNDLSGKLFGSLMIVAIFIVFFVLFKAWETKRALVTASFLTAIATIFFRLLGWITDAWMFGMFLIVGVTFLALYWMEAD